MSDAIPIGGTTDARFAGVRDAFAENFHDENDVEFGGAVAVMVGGRTVVDLWGGHVDEAKTRPWQRDTLVNVYSVGKGVLAILALACAEEGSVDLDATVASLWPAFAAEGKGRLTLRGLLAHRAGLPAVREILPDEATWDFDRICTALAGQAPYWEPGSDHGYHVNTQGHLVGEVLRRATGVAVGALLAQRLCGPLGIDFHWGLAREHHARVSRAIVPDIRLDSPEQWAKAFPPTGDAEHDAMIGRAYFNPPPFSGLGSVNTTAWREAVIPSTNGHGNARSVAQIYDAHLHGGARGVVLAGASLRREAVQTHSEGRDRVLGKDTRFGLGFQLPEAHRPLGPNAGAYGHFGYGGTLGMADPEADLAFAFVSNRPGHRWQMPRTERLLTAVYACLGS